MDGRLSIDAALAKCDRETQRWDEAYADEIISRTELKTYRADIDERRRHSRHSAARI